MRRAEEEVMKAVLEADSVDSYQKQRLSWKGGGNMWCWKSSSGRVTEDRFQRAGQTWEENHAMGWLMDDELMRQWERTCGSAGTPEEERGEQGEAEEDHRLAHEDAGGGQSSRSTRTRRKWSSGELLARRVWMICGRRYTGTRKGAYRGRGEPHGRS